MMPDLQPLLQAAVDAGVAPGLVAVAFDRAGCMSMASAGVRNLETKASMETGTSVYLASMCKVAVSLAALVLVEKHDFDIDSNDALAAVLPELKLGSGNACDRIFDGKDEEGAWKFKPATVGLTLRHLLLHASGFGYSFSSEEDASLHEPRGPLPAVLSGAVAAIEVPRAFDGGERWLYGCSTDWVGQFVERQSGLLLREALQALVFHPLGVPSDQLDFFRHGDMARNYAFVDAKVAPGTFVPIPFDTPQFVVPPVGFAHCATAGLWGTLPAWAKFLQCLLHESAPGPDAPPLISKAFWDAATRDGLGSLGQKVPKPMLVSADLQVSNNIEVYSLPADETASASSEGWSMLSCIVHQSGTGKKAGTFGWSGVANAYYFVDNGSGVGGVVAAQFLPFADEGMLKLRDDFERAIYAELDAVAKA